METTQPVGRKSEKGFTLVELAVVMIIIGLLIGGILKGQELISNAQIAATVAQVKAIDAATTTFRDKYDSMPGDMLNAAARLPSSCTGSCLPAAGAGLGDNRVTGAFTAVPTAEMAAFFQQLSAADLIGGVVINGVTNAFGSGIYPEAEAGGGYVAAYWPGGPLGANTGGSGARAGHYLALYGAAGAAVPAGGTTLTPNQAFRIDNKIDDGNGQVGTIFASDGAGAAACQNGAYNENQDLAICDLYIRFQQ